MRVVGLLIAATVLVGMLWGGAAGLADKLGVKEWLQTKVESGPERLQPQQGSHEQR
jgi:hypothetical protein